MSSSKRQIVANLDQLSTLPVEIQIHILSFASTIDAAKTSFLSKNLKSAWLSIPKLIINYNRFPGAENDSGPLARFINKTLTDHDNSDVKIFGLELWPTDECDIPIKNEWITFAIHHKVENFILYGNLEEFQKLPSCLFSCSSLVKLELAIGNVVLTLPEPEHFALPNLKKLKLRFLDLSEVGFGRDLFSRLPALEKLSIILCDLRNVKAISVASPKLKEFTICNCEGMENCSISLETPHLSKFVFVNIGVNDSHLNVREFILGLVLVAVGSQLKIGNDSDSSQLAIKVAKELFKENYTSHGLIELKNYFSLACGLAQLEFHHSDNLVLLNINVWPVMAHVKTTISLVSRCPNLEILNVTVMGTRIQILESPNVELDSEDWIAGEGLGSLELITFDNFDGSEAMMMLVKLFLGSAHRLIFIRISMKSDMRESDKNSSISRIRGYEKTSNHAQIVFR